MWLKIFPLLVVINLLYCNNTLNIDAKNSPDSGSSQIHSLMSSGNETTKNFENKAYGAVPTWYLQNRVQILAALLKRDMDQAPFFNVPRQLSGVQATVLTRAIKSGDEQPWWPSKYGTILPEAKKLEKNGKNLAEEIIDQMHDLGMKAVIYYRHLEDSQMLALHPDWACLDVNGKIIRAPRGKALSINSPYRDIIIQRVKELTLYGADGFYFDEVHIPLEGDFSSYSMNLYKQKYGANANMKTDYKAGKFQRFFDFRNESIQRFFDDLSDTLKASNLNPLLLVSGNAWPSFTDLHMTSSFFKNYTLKTELEVPSRAFKKRNFTMPPSVKEAIPAFYLNAFIFSFTRDNSLAPPNVWCPDVKSAKDAGMIAAGLISLGCVAEMHVGRSPDSRTDRAVIVDNFKTVLQWNKLYGNYFAKMVPYATTGILASEYQRDQFLGNPQKAWDQALVPSIQAFKKMYEIGLPVRLLSDADLQLKDYGALNNIFYNTTVKVPVDHLPKAKFLNLDELKGLSGVQLAQKTGSPVFCKKANEFTHVNYFKDNENSLYIVTAPDFNSVKKDFNEKSKTNLAYTKQAQYRNPKNITVYISEDKVADKTLRDIAGKQDINPVKTENGYYLYEIVASDTGLGLFSIKMK